MRLISCDDGGPDTTPIARSARTTATAARGARYHLLCRQRRPACARRRAAIRLMTLRRWRPRI